MLMDRQFGFGPKNGGSNPPEPTIKSRLISWYFRCEANIENKIKPKKDSDKPIVALIMTGGTIVNRLDPRTGAVAPFTSSEDFFKFYPEVFDIISPRIEMPFMKASEDMDFKDWQKIAKTAEKFLNDPHIKGI